jgi:hypothetical protein
MTRNSLWSSLLVSVLIVGAQGCEKAADQQEKAATAQNQANEKIIEASKEAQDKVNAAQSEADKKIADANATFKKMREDYRHKASEDLIELDKKVADLEARALKEKAKVKDELEARAKQVRAQRAEFEQHLNNLETATATTWDEMKVKLDKEWEDLKSLADNTKADIHK